MQKDDRRRREIRKITLGAIIGLLVLLVLPAAAAFRLCPPFDFRWVLGYWFCISAITHFAYAADKRKAELGRWRTPESTLHSMELLGGWPAAFLAQREFRHKISKRPYQNTFWAIVVVYQLVACDFLLEWAVSRSIWQMIELQLLLIQARG